MYRIAIIYFQQTAARCQWQCTAAAERTDSFQQRAVVNDCAGRRFPPFHSRTPYSIILRHPRSGQDQRALRRGRMKRLLAGSKPGVRQSCYRKIRTQRSCGDARSWSATCYRELPQARAAPKLRCDARLCHFRDSLHRWLHSVRCREGIDARIGREEAEKRRGRARRTTLVLNLF